MPVFALDRRLSFARDIEETLELRTQRSEKGVGCGSQSKRSDRWKSLHKFIFTESFRRTRRIFDYMKRDRIMIDRRNAGYARNETWIEGEKYVRTLATFERMNRWFERFTEHSNQEYGDRHAVNCKKDLIHDFNYCFFKLLVRSVPE